MKHNCFRRIVLFSALTLTLLVAPGCFLAPLFDSMHKAGVTEGDRVALLPMAVKKFHEALMWGDPNGGLAFVEHENFEAIKNDLRKRSRTEKVVESAVQSVDFRENAFYADVEVGIKHYQVPFYIVQERRELQKWHFSMTEGWKLQSREVLKSEG